MTYPTYVMVHTSTERGYKIYQCQAYRGFSRFRAYRAFSTATDRVSAEWQLDALDTWTYDDAKANDEPYPAFIKTYAGGKAYTILRLNKSGESPYRVYESFGEAEDEWAADQLLKGLGVKPSDPVKN